MEISRMFVRTRQVVANAEGQIFAVTHPGMVVVVVVVVVIAY